jgi:hypothetical protein
MKRKCAIVFFAIGMLLSAAQTEARDYEKRRPSQQTSGQIEQSIRACQRNCETAEKRCRGKPCIGVSGLACWADCTKTKWSCDDRCKNIMGRPQQPQQQQQQQPSPNQEASRRFCETNCSMSRSSCEGMCTWKTDLLEKTSCESSCRMTEFSCQNSCRF